MFPVLTVPWLYSKSDFTEGSGSSNFRKLFSSSPKRQLHLTPISGKMKMKLFEFQKKGVFLKFKQ